MKYFLDTEFIEDFHKPLFGRRRHFIDLISIALVCDDGREISLVSSEYRYKDASPWVKEHVILPMYLKMVHGDQRNRLSVDNFQKALGVPNEEIRKAIAGFCKCVPKYSPILDPMITKFVCMDTDIEFYAYFADYDWVLFCSLFGKMIQLPDGFPMYCIDLKQMLNEKQKDGNRVTAMSRIDEGPYEIKKDPDYPKTEGEHIAVADARWNKKLYEFICSRAF